MPMCRRLVILLLLAGISTIRADERDDRAALAIPKWGGVAVRDAKIKGNPIVQIDLAYAKIGADELAELRGLQHLREL